MQHRQKKTMFTKGKVCNKDTGRCKNLEVKKTKKKLNKLLKNLNLLKK